MEDFHSYRTMCANRLNRLERYKKARSFCSLEDERPSTADFCENFSRCADDVPAETNDNSAFEIIREKMFALMENDMTILQQLLSLGDQIHDLKMRKCVSQQSLDDAEEMEDQFEETSRFSSSTSAVTNLFVEDVKPQYFSRQNSVLRIPIPPRSSNRFGSKRATRRASDVVRRNLHIEPTSSECSPLPSPNSSLSHNPSTVSSCSSECRSTARVVLPPTTPRPRSDRCSNSSIDSGIRDSSSNSPSPTFDKERQI